MSSDIEDELVELSHFVGETISSKGLIKSSDTCRDVIGEQDCVYARLSANKRITLKFFVFKDANSLALPKLRVRDQKHQIKMKEQKER